MNKNLYRIVFNRARGQLMAVAEIVAPQGKQPGTRSASRADGRAFTLLPLSFAAMLALGSAALADGIVADPAAQAARQPTVGQAANGVTVVQIAAPSAAGVSHNQYQQFNVGAGGAILNNSTVASKTQLAGYIDGNANLAGTSARIILNEVTRPNPSTLGGYLEVAGQRAQVVIANPWGISCSGCGFINTSSATLTTGVPQLNAQGALTGYRVNDGTVTLGEVNVADLDSFAIISRALKLNGALYAKRVDAVLGRNQVDASTLQATPLAADAQTTAAPAFALDVAALGGMYANAIHLIGTEKGVGVNQQGRLAADSGALQLSSAGDLTLAGTQSAVTRLDAHADGDLTLSGTAAAQQSLTLSADGTLRQSGQLWSQHDLSLSGKQIDSSGEILAGVRADGTLGADGSFILRAGQDARASGRWRAAGTIDAQAGQTLDLSGADLNAVSGIRLDTDGRILTANAQASTLGLLQTRADTLDNSGGSLTAGTMSLQQASLLNDHGSLIQSGSSDWTLRVDTLLSNRGGVLLGHQASLTVNAGQLDNRAGGQIASDRALSLDASRIDNDAGLIQGGTALTTHATKLDNGRGQWLALGSTPASLRVDGQLDNAGTLSAAGALQLDAGQLNNRGTISSQGALQLQGTALDNSAGTLSGQGDVTLTLSGALGNAQGKISSAGLLNLQLASLDNGSGTLHGANLILATQGQAKSAGKIDSAGTLSLTAGSLDNGGGQIQSGGDMTLALGAVDQGGTVSAGRDLSLNLAGADGRVGAGQFKANRDLSLSGKTLHNAAQVEAVRTLAVQAETLDNSGALTGGTALHATLTQALNNRASGGLNASDLQLNAPAIDNAGFISGQSVRLNGATLSNHGDQAFIGSGGDMLLAQTRSVENLDGAEINAQGNLRIGDAAAPMDLLHNRTARILIEGNGEVNAKQVLNESNPVTVTHEETTHSETKTAYVPPRMCLFGGGVRGDGCNEGKNGEASRYGILSSRSVSNVDPISHTLIFNGSRIYYAYTNGSEYAYLIGFNPTTQFLHSFVDKFYAGASADKVVAPVMNLTDFAVAGRDLVLNLRGNTVTIETKVTTDIASAQPSPAYFEVGGDLSLNTQTITNRYSVISAAGKLNTMPGTALQNIGQTLNRVTTQLWSTGTVVAPVTEQLGSLDAVFSSNKPLTLNLRTLQNGAVTPGVIVPDHPVPGANGPKSALNTGSRLLDPLPPDYKLPDGGLFHHSKQPNAHYLVETDPRFTRYASFVSSDAMLSKLGFDPSTLQKRLGDGYYEQQLVSQAIARQTGQRYLQGFNNGNQQYQALLDNGVAAAGALQLTPGVALSAEQIKSLKQDMVWLVSRTVNGEQVLVPEVYLAAGDGARERSQGATLAAQSMNLQVDGALVSNGTLHADGDLVAKADSVSMPGAKIEAGNLALGATQDLTLTATQLDVKGDAILGAGHDLRIGSARQQYALTASASNRLRTFDAALDVSVSQASQLNVGGSLQMQAGNDFALTGSSAHAGGGMDIAAGHDLTVASTVDHQNSSAFENTGIERFNRSETHQQQTLNQAGLQAGGDMRLQAGHDIALAAAQLQSTQGAIGAAAGNDVRMTDLLTANRDHSFGGWTWNMSDGGDRVSSSDTHHGSTLQAATGLQVQAGNDIAARAATLATTQGAASLLAGRDIDLSTAVDSRSFQHHTDFAGKSEGVYNNAETLAQSSVQGQDGVLLQAGRDIGLNSAQLAAAKGQVAALAGNDIKLTTTATHSASGWWDKGGSRADRSDTTQNGAAASAASGLTLAAGQDLAARAATLATQQGSAQLSAGRDLTLDTAVNVHDDYTRTVKSGGGMFSRSSSTTIVTHHNETDVGSLVKGDDIVMNSGRDLTIKAGQVAGSGDVGLQAVRDISIISGKNSAASTFYQHTQKSGFGTSLATGVTVGGKVTRETSVSQETEQIASTVSGKNLSIQAGRDASAQASNLLADQSLQVLAGRDVNILSAANTQHSGSSYDEHSWTASVLGGLAPSQTILGINSSSQKNTQDGVTQSTSLLSANGGDLTVKAGLDTQYRGSGTGNLLSQGANLQAAKDITLQGNSVDLQAISNSSASTSHSESHSFTVGAQLAGLVGSQITAAYQTAQAASEAQNGRLQGALALKAGYDAYKLNDKGLADGLKTQAAANKALDEKTSKNNNSAAIGISVNLGVNHSSQDSESKNSNQRGTIVQGDQLAIKATEGDLSATGAKLQARNIDLDAAKNLNLNAAQNTAEIHSNQSGGNVGFGVTFGYGQQSGVSFQIGAGRNTGISNGSELQYDNTLVTATQGLNLHSGQDTTLRGAQLAGDKVSATVGGKLNIETLQDKSEYESHQSSSGFNIDLCIPPICYGQMVSGSINMARQDINHDYLSAVGQSGIAAGAQGFNLLVGGGTTLTGAAITSQAGKDKNLLQTASLESRDLDNHQHTEASASSTGLSYSGGNMLDTLKSNAISNIAGNVLAGAGLPQNEDQHSQTKSVISPAAVSITGSGDAAKDTASRATAAELQQRDASKANGALTNSLTLQQAQELQAKLQRIRENAKASQIVGEVGNQIVGDVAQKYGWEEGSSQKIALHAMLGALQSKIGDGSALAGASAGAAGEWVGAKVEEYLETNTQLSDQERKAIQIWAAAATGLVSASVADGGKNALSGVAVAVDAEMYNRQLHQSEFNKAKRYAKLFQQYLAKRGEKVTEDQAAGRLVRQMERWADYATAKQDGFKEDQSALAFLGKGSVKVSMADYLNPSVSMDVAKANPDLIRLGQYQAKVGLTPAQIADNKNKQKFIALSAAGVVMAPFFLSTSPLMYVGGTMSGAVDASSQYFHDKKIRPEQTAVATVTGGLLTPVGMSVGALGNISLGAISNVVNTTFQDIYYTAGGSNKSSLLWSAGTGAAFGFLGYATGGSAQSMLVKRYPVFNSSVSAVLQKPQNSSKIISNFIGGVAQGMPGVFVPNVDNNSLP